VIRTAALRAERLIGALLVLSRTESGHLDHQAIDFDELVGDVVAQLVVGTPWVDLRVDVELHPVRVIGDHALLESLVTNLVDNAGQHNVGDGWVHVAVFGEASHAVFEVTNSVGERHGGGNGVGLTIVEAIVSSHHGELQRTDLDNGEHVVRVLLPRATDDPGAFDQDTPQTTSTDAANALS
jgi:two-component system OmpR family sensor kinase